MTFTLTAAAAARIRRAAGEGTAGEGTADEGTVAKDAPTDWALRVAARRDDDGSLQYGMGFDETREGDMPLEVEGVRLLIGPPSQALLQGTQLDYVELEPGRFDFIFIPDGADAPPPPPADCGSGGCSRCGS